MQHRQFLRRLDHELKNPLTAVRAAVADASQSASPAIAVNLEVVDAQSRRMSRLLTDLRKLAELETASLALEDVDLAETVTQSAAIATPVLVVADVAQQLQDLDWENDSYSSDPPSRSSSGSSNSSLRSSCSAGNMADCDSLFYSSPYGSDDESFGKSCGGRSSSMRSGGDCKSTYGTRH